MENQDKAAEAGCRAGLPLGQWYLQGHISEVRISLAVLGTRGHDCHLAGAVKAWHPV